MSRTYHHGSNHRRIRVRGERRPTTDTRRLARALIELEYKEAQQEAKAEQENKDKKKGPPKGQQP